MMTIHSMKIRARWNSATTAKITPATRENVFALMSHHPKFLTQDSTQGGRRLRTSSERFGHGREPATTGRADLLPKGPIPWASRHLNLTKLRSPFGHGIELRYRRCCIGGLL